MRIDNKGFTLVELLVVIAVIVLLAVLAAVALGDVRSKSNDLTRLGHIQDVQAALENYFVDHNEYPKTGPEGIQLGVGNAICFNVTGFAAPNCSDPYLQPVPADPGVSLYRYMSADGKSYTIDATLEAGTPNLRPGHIVVTPSGTKNK